MFGNSSSLLLVLKNAWTYEESFAFRKLISLLTGDRGGNGVRDGGKGQGMGRGTGDGGSYLTTGLPALLLSYQIDLNGYL
mgnify:CR=1 FL=1